MATSKLLALMQTLPSGVQEVLIAVRDVKTVNRVVEIVGKDGTFDSQDPSLSFEIEDMKHSLREAVILSGRFIIASKSLAKYSSNEGYIQQIKDELTAGNLQKLKPFLDGIAGYLSRCRMRVEEYQAEYGKVKEKTRQLMERRDAANPVSLHSTTEQDVSCHSYFAGVSVALFLPGLVALVFKEFRVFFALVYVCLSVSGFVFGKNGYTFLLARSTFNSQQARGRRLYNNEIQLQSSQDSISTFLAKAPGTRSKLLQLEQCAKEASECVGTIAQQGRNPTPHLLGETEKYNQVKAQLDELQQQMTQLLKCVDEESDTEQQFPS